ncbi:MAG: MoxR family ATPase [Planctomycetota bacterium]
MVTVRDITERIVSNIEKVVMGKRGVIELALACLYGEGHILFEDVPGVAKTMLARSLALSFGVSFQRIQCTPDLLPTDVTGTSVFNQKTAEFEFRPGPILSNIVLADEINRATPRTQSAFLEGMQEHQVTVDGKTHPCPSPFMVVATQNPVEHEGTFPLPEAQLDRFIMRISVGYPTFEDEMTILQKLQKEHPIQHLGPVATASELVAIIRAVREVHIEPAVRRYLLMIVRATRDHRDLALGASPRSALALERASQALAAVAGRSFVLPDDVKRAALPVLVHRVLVRPESRIRRVTAGYVLAQILEETAAPVGKPQELTGFEKG